MSTITTRSGKGAPLTNNEVDSNFTNLNTDKAELSGATFTGDVKLGDNDKATFGASDDLQIYHDGSNSYIDEVGIGNLLINADSLRLRDTGGNPYFLGNVGAEVRLYHAGSTKLVTTSTGVDVTGSVVADGATLLGGVEPLTVKRDGTGTQASAIFIKDASDNAVRLESTNSNFTIQNTASNLDRLLVANNGDISFYEDTGTTPKMVWDASAESLNFADNGKATFGAGDDLQIFHDGSNSIIKDGGTGNLNILAGQLRIKNPTDAESLIEADVNGAVRLYHDNAEKLATTATGIDVTGKATMDGLDIEGAGAGLANFYRASANANFSAITFKDTTNTNINAKIGWNANELRLDGTNNVRLVTAAKNRLLVTNNGDISFYEDTGTTAKLFWDASAESLGIGTSSPSHPLTIQGSGTSGNAVKIVGDSTNNTGRILWRNSADSGGTGSISVDSSKDMVFGTGTSAVERMRIDATGQTTITAVGNPTLTVKGSAGAYSSFLVLQAAAGGGSTINATGATSSYLNFQVDGSNKVRIDSAGNLLVGKSGTNFGAAGIELHSADQIYATSTTHGLALNRLSTDGDIAKFYKDGTTVGSIGVAFNDLNINGGANHSGIRFQATGLYPLQNGSASSGLIDLGAAGSNFKDLYLSGGVYLGGTGAANLLDDYEEGTWTATIADATTGGNTTSTYTGRYTKIGNLVTVFVALTNIDTTGLTAGNVMYVQGLPFTSNVNNHTVGTCKVDTVNLISRTYIYANMGGNDSWLNFQTAGDNIGEANIDAQHITSGTSDIQFTLQYIV